MSMTGWPENGTEHTARWRSENGAPPPARLEIIDDTVTANTALRRIRGGAGLLWRGDYHNAREAYGELQEPTLVSLTELLGVLSARQWHERGVTIPAIGARIHPRYSVFSPVRSEYVDLVAGAPLPGADGGADIVDPGTGTGVLAAVLARRGAARVVATDINPRAVDCAREHAAPRPRGPPIRRWHRNE